MKSGKCQCCGNWDRLVQERVSCEVRWICLACDESGCLPGGCVKCQLLGNPIPTEMELRQEIEDTWAAFVRLGRRIA